MTRIVAGTVGGRRIEVPRSGTRPTSERVREALFARLDHYGVLDGARVLDLCAGSGALGLEAASRGLRVAIVLNRVPPGAAQEGTQPGHDLLQGEGLGHVVVAACGQPGHAVLDGVLGRQEQDRHVRAVAAHPAHDLQSVEVGKHDVQDDDVGVDLLGGAHGCDPGPGSGDLPSLVTQGGGEQVGEHLLVVDDQDAQGGAVGTGEVLGGGVSHVIYSTGRRCARPQRNLCLDCVTDLRPNGDAATRAL